MPSYPNCPVLQNRRSFRNRSQVPLGSLEEASVIKAPAISLPFDTRGAQLEVEGIGVCDGWSQDLRVWDWFRLIPYHFHSVSSSSFSSCNSMELLLQSKCLGGCELGTMVHLRGEPVPGNFHGLAASMIAMNTDAAQAFQVDEEVSQMRHCSACKFIRSAIYENSCFIRGQMSEQSSWIFLPGQGRCDAQEILSRSQLLYVDPHPARVDLGASLKTCVTLPVWIHSCQWDEHGMSMQYCQYCSIVISGIYGNPSERVGWALKSLQFRACMIRYPIG